MKKFLLSIFCLFSIISYATADEAKFDFTQPSGLTPSITDDMFSDAGGGAFAFGTTGTLFTSNSVTLSTTDGSTVSRIWKATSGTYDLRLYKTATMTFKAPEGAVITAIAFTGGTVNEFSADEGTVGDKNWTGAATSVVFTWSGSAKTQKISDITVTFSTDGSVTPDPEEPEGGEGEDGNEDEVGGSITGNILSNPGFENWTDGKPDDWATHSTSNAAIEQSNDAHSGSYSVVVNGTTSNKRFASKAYKLAAGSYTMTAYVKANGEDAGFYRLGYATIVDGAAKDYIYTAAAATAAPAEWTKATFDFTLTAETELVLIVMNNKSGNGASFLVDDITLTVANTEGGEGEGEDEGETETTFSTIAEVIAAGAGDAATTGTVVATYARGFLMSDKTGSILVFQGATPAVTFTEGDIVTVKGTTSVYGGLLQFGNSSVVEKTGTATVNHPTATVMDGAAMDAYLATPEIKFVEYTGTLTISGSYYNVAVDGAATAIGSIQYPNTGLVTAASGDKVKVTGYTIGVSSSKYVNTMAVKVETVEDEGEGEVGGEDEELEEVTIEEVLDAGAGKAKTSGTIVATYARGFLLDDGTGSILVYLGSDNGHVTGDIVAVEGTTSMYGGLLQFGNGTTVEKRGTNSVKYPTATAMDGAAMDAYLTAPAITYVEYTGTLTISGNYYNVAVEGAATAIGSIQYPKEGVVTAASGDKVKVTGYTIGVSSSKYVNTMAVKVEILESGEEEPGGSLETEEYTVTEALAAYVDGQQIPAIVKGFIVGAMNSSGYVPEFGATTINTNILLSDNADEADIANCIIVQLPKGNIRSELNLVDHPENYKKEVKITGSIEKYFQQAGLKNPTAYEFTGVTGIMNVIDESNIVKTIFDITGRRIDNITRPGIYIVNGKKVLVK